MMLRSIVTENYRKIVVFDVFRHISSKLESGTTSLARFDLCIPYALKVFLEVNIGFE